MFFVISRDSSSYHTVLKRCLESKSGSTLKIKLTSAHAIAMSILKLHVCESDWKS